MGSSEKPIEARANSAAASLEPATLPDAPLTLAGSAPSWSLSYTPSRDIDSATTARTPGEAPRQEPSADALEGLALSLWDKGQKQEAISVLERQIALQKTVPAAEAIPPARRFRMPVKTALAAVMLFAIGGALWGGLNPSMDDGGVLLADEDKAPAADTSENVAGATLAQEQAPPAVQLASAEPKQAQGPVRQVSADEPRGEAIEPAEEESEIGASDAGGPAESSAPQPAAPADAEPELPVSDGPPPELPEETEIAAADALALVREARLPKPRPDLSAKEAQAFVQKAAPVRPAAKRQRPATPTAVMQAPEPPASQVQPEVYAWQPQPDVVPFDAYRPYPGGRVIVLDPRLAEQRAMAEWYIVQQRQRALMEQQQAAEDYGDRPWGMPPMPPFGY